MDPESLSNPDLLIHVKTMPAPTPLEIVLADRLEEATRELERLHQLALRELGRLSDINSRTYA